MLKKHHHLLLKAFFLLLLLILFSYGIQNLSNKSNAQLKQSLERALNRSCVQCYALEGHYPESLDYLKEHYGITYDEEKFLVDYRITGSNIMPQITVLFRTQGD